MRSHGRLLRRDRLREGEEERGGGGMRGGERIPVFGTLPKGNYPFLALQRPGQNEALYQVEH